MTLSRAELVRFVSERVAARLGAAAAQDRDADLFELGLDSVEAVELTGEIEVHFGLEVDPALAFEQRSINHIAEALVPEE